ncbi:MAG: TRAP transporter substrate-binding protein DctP [Acidobacteriota bacterium]
MSTRLSHFVLCVALISVGLGAWPRAQGAVRIRMGTVVPKGSLWEESLHYVRQEWLRISNSAIQVTIYPGGVLGDEVEMVRQVRQGRIQAVALSAVGLSRIDDSVSCLQVPMMFRSYEELDYVRDRLAATLEARIAARGFVVLHWADGGWVHTFSKSEARTPQDVQRLKLFTSAGDPETERLYKEFGFRVVPLSMTDMTTSLQTGMIDAFSIVPLFAQLEGLYKLAPHMLDVRWTPLVGGTVISQQAWNQMAESDRPALLAAARAAGARLKGEIRAMGDDAVREMQKRGLQVTTPDEAALAAWQSAAESAYPQLRGRYCPADVFDEVLRLRDESRRTSR